MPFSWFDHEAESGIQNKDWWPNQLNLDILRQHKRKVTSELNYKEEVVDQVL